MYGMVVTITVYVHLLDVLATFDASLSNPALPIHLCGAVLVMNRCRPYQK